MSLLQAGFGSSGDDYEITDSLRLRSSASAYLARTPASAGNRRTWTLSWWAKRGALGSTGFTVFSAGTSASDTGELVIKYDNNYPDSLAIQTGSTNIRFTNALYRDPSAWHHVVVAFDTTQGTASNRTKVYVNGAQITSFNISNDLAQNTDTAVNNNVTQEIGVFARLNSQYLDGYLTEVQMIDGQQLDADDFGEFDANGTWKPKRYTGTYGTNGFYLPMKPTTQADGFNTVLYTGDGTSVSVNGVGFSPDFVWIKNRDDTNHHRLYDTVRGSHQMLSSSQSAAEQSKGGGLTSFDSDGFSVGNDGSENNSGDNFVAWTWDAGDNQPSTGISSVTYTGNGATQSIKGFGFSPDFVWIKPRNAVGSHILQDTVRGNTKFLESNSTGVEQTNSSTGFLSFDSDGFTVGSGNDWNNSGETFVAWGWDAGDGDPVSNTTGDINSTVKANDTYGFSIVSYTGNGTSNSEQTIGHGLSTAPKVVIVKDRTSASTRWTFYSTDLSSDGTYAVKNLILNTTSAESAYSSQIRGIQASDTFSVRDVDANGNANVNKSGDNYIAYCFSEVSGVSKFDSYTGTNSTGNSVTTGFRPGFVMIKNASASASWNIIDSTRSPFSTTGNGQFQDRLFPNASSAESTNADVIEFTNTGFVINAVSSSQFNNSGNTYIYMAFKGSYSDHVSPLNDTGTIDSRVKANDTYGFSIASYTGNGTNGATVGHGLSTTPSVVIVKDRNNTNNWAVYHKDLTSTSHSLVLNSTSAEVNYGSSFIAPAASTLSLANGSQLNASSRAYIAYCFSEVAGYSKIDSYTGTGSAGNSVTSLGFQPAWLMIKETTSAGNWAIIDTTRSPNYDAQGEYLWANLTDASGGASAPLTFDSDGFTINSGDSDTNSSGQTYIYMAFADTADARFNFDASGNKNNWLPNNINSNAESETTYDLMKDTPSLVDENAANFAVINPLVGPSADTISEGNLKIATSLSYAAFSHTRATIGVSSGKWYWEVEWDATSATSAESCIGITTAVLNPYSQCIGQGDANVSYGYRNDAQKFSGGSVSSYGATYTVGDVIGVALDLDAGTLAFYKNGSAQGTAYSSISGTYFPGISDVDNNNSRNSTFIANFGQRPFAYTPPSGFLKLNTFNLSDSTIEDGSDYFTPVIYTGNGSNQDITTGHSSDFVWIKSRSSTTSHGLYDNVRGTNKPLNSNNTNAEADYGAYGVDAFLSTGFGVTDIASSGYGVNENTVSYVAWSWEANGSGVSNTDGSVTSTVSANTTAGFSIVSFTSPGSGSFTMGHGLGASPDLIIMKRRASAANWGIFHSTVCTSEDNYFIFNTNALISYTDYWGTALPTSTVFGANVGASAIASEAMIAYCWKAVEGYSAFGSYTGNGSADGTFVYTGFRPAFVIMKRTDTTGNWTMFDSNRDPYNIVGERLYANLANAESGSSILDFLSNGFKLRINTNDQNPSGGTMIYMAFAENPFKNANAR